MTSRRLESNAPHGRRARFFASVLAVAVLGEPFETYHAVALALVFGGIWLSEMGRVKQAR